MFEYKQMISGNLIIKLLIITLVMDTFFGSLRAIKEHSWNSTIGINGTIRKIGMIGGIFFLSLVDMCLNLNLISEVPNEVIEIIKIDKVGICELFGLVFILYESTSILKNMVLCDLPVLRGLLKGLEKILKKMTSELDGKEGVKNGR